MGEPRFLCIAAGSDGGLVLGWRLLGANNRELGRSPQPFPDAAGCREAIRQLRSQHRELVTVVEADPQSLAWRWAAVLAGAEVAVSARRYPRPRECRYAVHRFLMAVPRAETVTEVRFRNPAGLRAGVVTAAGEGEVVPG